MNYQKWSRKIEKWSGTGDEKFSAPGDRRRRCLDWCLYWFLNSVLCCLPNFTYIGSFLPIPAFTNLYRFFLDVKFHQARSKSDFKEKINDIEELIKKHEDIGKFKIFIYVILYLLHYCYILQLLLQ